MAKGLDLVLRIQDFVLRENMMKRGILFLVTITVIFCAPAFGYDWSTNPGDGSPENPYQISTPDHLMSIGSNANLLDKHFILTNDIVFDPDNTPAHVFTQALIAPDTNNSSSGFQGTAFAGAFNGKEHVITNLKINNASNDYLGLFGFVESVYEIKNLSIENAYIKGDNNIGGLIGFNESANISYCSITGNVIGEWNTGGLIGQNETRGIIQNCNVEGNISGGQGLGGLIANNYGEITNCSAICEVNGTANFAGGLTGSNGGNIRHSYAFGDVSGVLMVGGFSGSNGGEIDACFNISNVQGDRYIGGFVGGNGLKITNCYAEGYISGDESIGGFVGINDYSGNISYCYAACDIEGNEDIGGIAGRNYVNISNCLWDYEIQTHGLTDGGSIGYSYSGSVVINVFGLTTEQMQTQSFFTNYGWDFVGEDMNGENEIWRMCADGVDTPRLSWEFARNGDFACGDGVDLADLLALAEHWLLTEAANPTTFNYACDANGDEQINLEDFWVLSENW